MRIPNKSIFSPACYKRRENLEGTPIKGIKFGVVGYAVVVHCSRDDGVLYYLNMVMNILMFHVCYFMPKLLEPWQQIFGYQLIVMQGLDEFGLKVNMAICLDCFPSD